MVENLNDIIFTIDTEGYIKYVNSVATGIFGYTIDELIGRNFDSFVFPDDLPGLLADWENTIAGNLHPCEFRMLDKEGKIHYVLPAVQYMKESK